MTFVVVVVKNHPEYLTPTAEDIVGGVWISDAKHYVNENDV